MGNCCGETKSCHPYVPSQEVKVHPSPQAPCLQTMLSLKPAQASPAWTSLQTTSSRRAQRVHGPKKTAIPCVVCLKEVFGVSGLGWCVCLREPLLPPPHVHVPPGHGNALHGAAHYAAHSPHQDVFNPLVTGYNNPG